MRSRCTQGNTVHYQWFGQPINVNNNEHFIHVLARTYAQEVANDALHEGQLNSRTFNKFVARLTADTEQFLERISLGKIKPGSEVTQVARWKDKQCPLTELRWHHFDNLLQCNNKTIETRHYVAEPAIHQTSVYGLVLHRKQVHINNNTTNNETHDAIINNLQNQQIDRAITLCKLGIDCKWNIDLFKAKLQTQPNIP